MFLFLRAFWQLIRFDYYLSRGNFAVLYKKVRDYPLKKKVVVTPEVIDRACRAIDWACVWYPKQVMCLQRSSATTCLLRAYGARTEMVIGVQRLPFKAHAWVEVDGRVVSDTSYTPEMYAVLDRC